MRVAHGIVHSFVHELQRLQPAPTQRTKISFLSNHATLSLAKFEERISTRSVKQRLYSVCDDFILMVDRNLYIFQRIKMRTSGKESARLRYKL